MTLAALVRSVTTPTTTTEARVLLAQVAEQLAGNPAEHTEEAEHFAYQLCHWAMTVAPLKPEQRALWEQVFGFKVVPSPESAPRRPWFPKLRAAWRVLAKSA